MRGEGGERGGVRGEGRMRGGVRSEGRREGEGRSEGKDSQRTKKARKYTDWRKDRNSLRVRGNGRSEDHSKGGEGLTTEQS